MGHEVRMSGGGWIIPLFLLAPTGCGSESKLVQPQVRVVQEVKPNAPALPGSGMVAASSAIKPWNAVACANDASIQTHPNLVGRTVPETRAAFGRANNERRFKAGEAVGVFETAAVSSLPKAFIDGNKEVFEITWTKAGCNMTVWFVEKENILRAFDVFEWRVGSEF